MRHISVRALRTRAGIRRVDELISEIIGADLVVEINTKAWRDYGRFFPSQRYWKRLIENNVTIVVDSDAHYPELIDASRREATDLLKKIKAAAFMRPSSHVAIDNVGLTWLP